MFHTQTAGDALEFLYYQGQKSPPLVMLASPAMALFQRVTGGLARQTGGFSSSNTVSRHKQRQLARQGLPPPRTSHDHLNPRPRTNRRH
jgi:hypothetical protein